MAPVVASRSVRLGLASLLVVAAAAVLAWETPGAFRSLAREARYNASRDATGRLLAAADELELDNAFLERAQQLPPDARYALLIPGTARSAAASYHLKLVTYVGVTPYVRYLLMPRRMTSPGQAQYLLCFDCNTAPWDRRTHWFWNNHLGLAIGRLLR